jgi:hypothetical protein
MRGKETSIDHELDGSLREYMLYFVGLDEDASEPQDLELAASRLLKEVPYSCSRVKEDLERLEDGGYINLDNLESLDSDIHPVETDGFDDILEDTVYSPVETTTVSLEDRGIQYVEETDLFYLQDSLGDTFQDDKQRT